MGFSTDYTDVSDGGGILPAGEYEAIIKYAGEDTTKGGTVYINVTLAIRNDVEQKYKNKIIWHKLWHRKEPAPADIACGGYSSKQINSMSKAAGLPNNKKYESLADWCGELKDKPVRITVEHEEYNSKVEARVKWVNESRCLPCNHEWKGEGHGDSANTSFHNAGHPIDVEFTEVNEDDCPF